MVTCLPAGREHGINQYIKMEYTVYAIRSAKDRSIYVGMTNDLNRRLKEHHRSRTKSTKSKLPYRLIYKEKAPDRKEARIREKYLKSGIGKEFLKSIRAG